MLLLDGYQLGLCTVSSIDIRNVLQFASLSILGKQKLNKLFPHVSSKITTPKFRRKSPSNII